MKLLFDQNLSHKLPRTLSDLFPGSTHVRDVGLKEADDPIVWEYAKQNQFVIVSKDLDMHQRSLVFHRSSSGYDWATALRLMSRNY